MNRLLILLSDVKVADPLMLVRIAYRHVDEDALIVDDPPVYVRTRICWLDVDQYMLCTLVCTLVDINLCFMHIYVIACMLAWCVDPYVPACVYACVHRPAASKLGCDLSSCMHVHVCSRRDPTAAARPARVRACRRAPKHQSRSLASHTQRTLSSVDG